MATIPIGFAFVTWTGPATPLSTAPWIDNIRAVHDVSLNRRGFISYKKSSQFPDFTGLTPAGTGTQPRVYLFNTLTAFSLADSLVGVVTPVPASASTIVVAASNLAYNSRSLANNGGIQYDALAEFTMLTNSSNLTVNAYCFNETGYDSNIAEVWVNGVAFGQVPGVFPTGTTGAGIFQLVNLPGTGQRSVKFTLAGQQNYAGIKPFNSYVSLTSIIVPAGFSGQAVPITSHPNEFIYVYGDSTTQSHGAKSWPRVLNRDYRPNSDIYVAGASALVAGRFIENATKQAALLADYKATRAQGGYTKGKFWFDSMVNDVYFNAYDPTQLNGFYVAFAQMFLADSTLAADTLYFKSAIPTTAHNNGGNNQVGPGYPLFAYRDAMSAAVATIASARVRYADGTQLQLASYLTDGTHVNEAGDAYVAGTINTFLNQTAGASTGSLSSLAAEQFGNYIRLTTNSIDAVEYAMETFSSSNTFSAWQSNAAFSTPTAGPRVFKARLTGNTSIEVSTSITINKTMFANSAELTKVGTWLDPNGGTTSTKQAYSLTDGDYYSFTDTFTGFTVYQNRQENVSEIVVSVDGGAGVVTNISGPGYNYAEQRVYTVTGLAPGTHTVRVDSGAAQYMNIYAIELLGNPNTPVITSPANFTISGIQKGAITVPQVNGSGTSARVIAAIATTTDPLEYSLDGNLWQTSNLILLEALGTTAPLQNYYARRPAAPALIATGQLQLVPFYRADSAGGFTTNSPAGSGWLAYPPKASDAFSSFSIGDNNTDALIITLAAGERAEVWARQQANVTQIDIQVFDGARTAQATGGYTYDSSIGIIYTSPAAPAGGGTIKFYKNAQQPAAFVSLFRRLKV